MIRVSPVSVSGNPSYKFNSACSSKDCSFSDKDLSEFVVEEDLDEVLESWDSEVNRRNSSSVECNIEEGNVSKEGSNNDFRAES